MSEEKRGGPGRGNDKQCSRCFAQTVIGGYMPEQQKSNRGGSGRGQGRKPVKQGEETVTLSLRVTVAQREKLARLGGAEWLRTKIDKARET